MDKRLSVDIGNSRLKLGLFSEGEEPEYWIDPGLDQMEDILQDTQQITVSQTGKHIEAEEMLRSNKAHFVTFQSTLPFTLDYSSPETLGSDRIAAAAGAIDLYPGKQVLILDIGTCITLDILDASGVFRGGLISPGIEMRFRAMHEFTARLPLVKFNESVTFPGKSSTESMQVGVYQSIRHELMGYFNEFGTDSAPVTVLDCSGHPIHFDKAINYQIFAQPKLVLYGLDVIARQNA